MHFRLARWILLMAMCTTALSFSRNRYVEVHEINTNRIPSVEQLPPVDPAVHSFPTVPTVPLLPTCVQEGYFRDPFNCGKFYYCDQERAVPVAFYCQSGLIFNTYSNSCDSPELVQC